MFVSNCKSIINMPYNNAIYIIIIIIIRFSFNNRVIIEAERIETIRYNYLQVLESTIIIGIINS